MRTLLPCVAMAVLALGATACSDGDAPKDEITRIDGPAVVDEDELDG